MFHVTETFCHFQLGNGPGNLFLSDLQMSNANIGFLAMLLGPVSRIGLRKINCDLRFLVFSSFAKA